MTMEGQGTTITFGTTGYSLPIINVGEFGEKLEKIETTHLGTTGAKTFMAADLTEADPFAIECEYVETVAITLDGVAETITIAPAGSTKVRSISGWVSEWKHGGMKTGERQTMRLTVQPTGAVTQTTT